LQKLRRFVADAVSAERKRFQGVIAFRLSQDESTLMFSFGFVFALIGIATGLSLYDSRAVHRRAYLTGAWMLLIGLLLITLSIATLFWRFLP
jgi:uncharacterized membrane protein AbrB (regulator of aidB expression)